MIGAVLAGGRSRRFGDDKLLFRINGKPLILYAIEGLEGSSLIERVVIVSGPHNADLLRGLGYKVIVDTLSVGPIGGIYTALSLGDVFVIAGDMPAVSPEFVDYIIKEFIRKSPHACVPRWSNGYIEPLHAAYSHRIAGILWESIRAGRYKIKDVLEGIDTCYLPIDALPPEWRTSFFNINQKSDVAYLSISSHVFFESLRCSQKGCDKTSTDP